jgi:hypothetical protein
LFGDQGCLPRHGAGAGRPLRRFDASTIARASSLSDLQSTIRAGNEAITYYKDPHELAGKCDFVMANPPFNVDEVDADKIKGDKRPLFGLPGINKQKKVSNANYLWLSYFYSYLNETGRAGVVMSSQASSAGRDEATVRQKLIEAGAIDVMIDIRGNFLYTRMVPSQLWFFGRAKEKDETRRDHLHSRQGVAHHQDRTHRHGRRRPDRRIDPRQGFRERVVAFRRQSVSCVRANSWPSRVMPVIDQTIPALAKSKFTADPVAGDRYSRSTSIISSAYKRHGRILETALLLKPLAETDGVITFAMPALIVTANRI